MIVCVYYYTQIPRLLYDFRDTCYGLVNIYYKYPQGSYPKRLSEFMAVRIYSKHYDNISVYYTFL